MNIQEFKNQYPQYKDVPDVQLAQSLYNKYYKDKMTFKQFGTSFGISEQDNESGAVATFADEYSKGVLRGFLNTAAGAIGTAEFLIPGKQESLLAAKANIQRTRDRFNPTHEGAAAWSGRVLGEAIPFMATAMAGGYAGGAVTSALGKGAALGQALGSGGVAFAIEGDAAYDQAIKSGASNFQAQTERILVGSINAYLESLQIGKLIGFHEAGGTALKGFTRNIRNKAWRMVGGDIRKFTGEILKLAVSEGLQEAAQEGVSIGIPAALRGDYPRNEDGSPDYYGILTQIGEAGIGGAFAGTVLGGGGAFISATPEIAAPTYEEAKATADRINNSGLSPIEKAVLLRKLDENLETFDYQRNKVIENKVKGSPVVYHGTSRDFETFQIIPQQESPQLYGPGVYFTEDPELASSYAMARANLGQGANIREAKIESNKPFDADTNTIKRDDFVQSLKNVFSNINKPLSDVFGNEQWNQVGEETKKAFASISDLQHKISKESLTWNDMVDYINTFKSPQLLGELLRDYDMNPTDIVNYILRDLGYDAITHIGGKVTGGKPHKVWIAFESNQIKSAYTRESRLSKFAPTELTGAEQFRNKLDEVAVDIEQARPLEEEAISRERGRRFEEFRNIRDSVEDPRQRIAIAKQALKGRLKQDIAPMQDKFTKDSVDSAYDTITTSTLLTEGEQINAYEGLEKLLFDGIIPAKHELMALQKAGLLSKEATTQILKNRTISQRIWDGVKDLSFAPWSLLTSFDMSAGGRQGWKVLFTDIPGATGIKRVTEGPKLWLKSIARGYRAFFSEKYYNFIELKRKTNPLYTEAVKRGVDETLIDSATRGEELFASNLIQKIPGIRASARGFITTVNEMRFGWYFKGKELSEGMGMSAGDQKTLATIANDITGRGKLPKVLQKLQEVSLIFFAPKLTAALVRIPTADLIPSGKEMKLRQYSPARKMLAGTLVKFLGFTLATLYLLDRDDKDKIDVEWNPLSTDFLKVRHKKTRIDITGGYQPLLRTIAQLATGKRKSTESGRVYDAERTEIISRFLQSKLSPHAGLAVDLWKGETFLGKKLKLSPAGVSEQVYERLAPLFIQDVIDAIRFQGLGTAGVIAPLAWHGLGVQTYTPTLSQNVQTYKDRRAKEYFGVTWDELGPEAQKAIRAYYPDIAVQEAEAKIDREDYDFIGKILEEADQTGRKVMKQLNDNVRNELEKYVVDVGNIGRNVGSNWYLNDSRYKEYQKEIIALFNKYMPRLVNSREYKQLNAQERREILQDAIDEIKKYARMKLTTEATYSDLRNREQIKGQK